MKGGVLMESEKPASIVAMLRIFVLPTTAMGGVGHCTWKEFLEERLLSNFITTGRARRTDGRTDPLIEMRGRI